MDRESKPGARGVVMRAYTVGNPEGYEPALDGGEATKQPGGACFRHLSDAKAAVSNGYLPEVWFGGAKLPGRVYELDLPGTYEECTVETDDEVRGWAPLTVSAPVLRLFSSRAEKD